MEYLKRFVTEKEFPLLFNTLCGLKMGYLDIDAIFITGEHFTGKSTLGRIMMGCCKSSKGSCKKYFDALKTCGYEYAFDEVNPPRNTLHEPNWNDTLVELTPTDGYKYNDEIERVRAVCDYREKIKTKKTYPPRKLYQCGEVRDPIAHPAILLHVFRDDFENKSLNLPVTNRLFRLKTSFDNKEDDMLIVKKVLKVLEPWTTIRLLFIGRLDENSLLYKVPKDIIIMLGKEYRKLYN